MSRRAVTNRLRRVSELVRICRALLAAQTSGLPVAETSGFANAAEGSGDGPRLQSSPELSGRRPDPQGNVPGHPQSKLSNLNPS